MRRARHTDDEEWGVQAGWCASDDELEEAKKQTHDRLISQLGARRRGGVRWIVLEGMPTRRKAGELMIGIAPDSLHGHYYRRIQGLLREYGGLLVIAMAPGRKDGGS